MEVKLVHISPLELIVQGIRTCYQSFDNSDSYYEYKSIKSYYNLKFILGDKDKALIQRIIESDHHSTLEHSLITLDIAGFSRDVLQELSRHRIGIGASVKSSRYTLKELKEESEFIQLPPDDCRYIYDWERVSKYCVLTGEELIDQSIAHALDNARDLVRQGFPNDKVKYCLPGAYKTAGLYSFNFRSLRHLLELRTSPKALWEFQLLCKEIIKAIPQEYMFLIEDSIYKESKDE